MVNGHAALSGNEAFRNRGSGRRLGKRILAAAALCLCFSCLICEGGPIRRKAAARGLTVHDLRCEFRKQPLGIDVLHPRLSWTMEAAVAEDRGQYQTAYHIQVASSPRLLAAGKPDYWDSGEKRSSQCNNICYGGKPLQSGMSCYWRVKVRDRNGVVSKWSAPSCWRMGLLQAADWKGGWLKDSKPYPVSDSALFDDLPAPVFRREFRAEKKIKSAFLYVSGLGYYEAFMNGKRVGDHILDPGWTDYSKRVLYAVYDVKKWLLTGRNCIGIMLGNGWYNPLPLRMWGSINLRKELTVGQPQFILQLNITYQDGSVASVVSDKEWKVTDGPVLRNNIYLGEKYDARRALPGWNRPGFDDKDWRPVAAGNDKLGVLQSQRQPPIVAADTLRPQSLREISPGKYIADFGKNFGGIVRLGARGPAGAVIRIRYGELLFPDGSLNVMTGVAGQIKKAGIGGVGAPDTAYACDTFILSGRGKETFQPRFTFHGFRYAEVTGYPGKLAPGDIQGLVLHAAVPEAGSFTCSDTLINQVQQACRNTFLSNLFSVQSDCPHRERFGYGGDMLATCEAFMNNFDMAAFYAKAVQDYADAARPDGGLTETAPFVGIADDGLGGQSGPIEWGTVHPVLLDKLYRYYGNIDLIRQQYATVKNWVDFISRHAQGYIVDVTIGDHESIDPKPVAVSGTAFYYYNARLAARFAKLLDKPEDADKYTALAAKIKKAFIQKFLEPGTGKAGIHTEAAQSYALYFHLIPKEEYAAALQVLLQDITMTHQDHISTGMFGTKFILEVLSRAGYGREAYKMVTQKTFPGWGYMIARGATTIWEHWAFSDNTYSHNHPMFGVVSEWFYRYLAGIQPAPDAVGYDKILIRPLLTGLTWAKATYRSLPGTIISDWHIREGIFYLNISIPVNTTATVSVPVPEISAVREGGKEVLKAPGIRWMKTEKDHIEFQVGSGNYHFAAALRR